MTMQIKKSVASSQTLSVRNSNDRKDMIAVDTSQQGSAAVQIKDNAIIGAPGMSWGPPPPQLPLPSS